MGDIIVGMGDSRLGEIGLGIGVMIVGAACVGMNFGVDILVFDVGDVDLGLGD